MRLFPISVASIALLAATAASPAASADQLIEAGSETQINTYTTDNQGFPEIASLPQGGYVV